MDQGTNKTPPRYHQDTTEAPVQDPFARISIDGPLEEFPWSLHTTPAQGLYERALGKISLGDLYTSCS